MNRKHLLRIATIIIAILIISMVVITFLSNSNHVSVQVYYDGQNISVKTNTFPNIFHEDNQLKNEIQTYTLREVNELNSTTSSLEDGITDIIHKNGYEVMDIKISSQYGNNQLVMPINVDGTSMEGTLSNGSTVVILKSKNFHVGDIVVANHPSYGPIIKRVSKVNQDIVYLRSDNRNVTYINGIPYKGVDTWVSKEMIWGIYKFTLNN